ncbi:MAG: alpha/beta fold hydrolase [Deltaproteobacteria bacterium]|nr:alpha/beta fold hydrolase [Deltaproteobacteria bacterium]
MPVATVGDIQLHYDLVGNGPSVVLVPGLSLDSRIWEPVTGPLEHALTCLMPDNRGAGLTDVPRGPYSMNQMAGDLYGLLMILGVDSTVVVGHSMGGYVALQLALDSPELVCGLVLVSTSATGRQDLLGMSDEGRRALSRTRGPIEEIARGNIHASVGQRFLEEHPDRVDAFVAARIARPPRGRGVQGQRAAADAFDARERLWELQCACTVIHGTGDRLIPVERGRELAQGIEGARLVELDEIGHLPQLEAPAELAAEIGRATGVDVGS